MLFPLTASSANDSTVRLWDTDTNDAVDQAEELTGVGYNGLDILHDGSRFVTGTEDGTIHSWDTITLTKIRTLKGHTARIVCLKYSLDGKYIISTPFDCSVRLWDSDSGMQSGCMNTPDRLYTSALSLNPDNKHFAFAGGDGLLHLWNMETREEVVNAFTCFRQVDHYDILTLCYSKDGKFLASGGDEKCITILQIENAGNMTSVWKRLQGHSDPISDVVFSPNTEKLVSGDQCGIIRIWNVETGEPLRRIDWHAGTICGIITSPDGTRFATASRDHFMAVWDLNTGERVGESLRGHSDGVKNAIYTPDGETIISVSDDSTLRTWDAEAMQTNYVAELDLSLSHLDLDDGWITNKEGGLVLWVPPEQRSGVQDVCIKCIPDNALGHPVKLDWSKFLVRGSWTDILKET